MRRPRVRSSCRTSTRWWCSKRVEARPCSPARPVRPTRWMKSSGKLRQVVVDHVRDVLHVNSTRSQVGRDQNPHPALLKRGQRCRTLRLRTIAVNHRSRIALAAQPLRQTFRGCAWSAQTPGTVRFLSPAVAAEHPASHPRKPQSPESGHSRTVSEPIPARPAPASACGRSPGARPMLPASPRSTWSGGSSAARPQCVGRQGMNPMSIMRSASSSTRMRSARKSTSRRSRKSSRRPRSRNDQSRSTPDGLDLLFFGEPSDHDGGFGKLCAPQGVVLFCDLHRKFARRNQHQGMDAGGVALQQMLHHRKQERQGLAGARLGGGQDVFALECRRNRCCLHGCGNGKAKRCHAFL